MSNLDIILDANRAALDDFLAAADLAAGSWMAPKAPGKWSPSQVTEHVARTMDEGAKVILGKPSAFPNLPSLFRPLLRGLFFNRVIRKGAFPKAKTMKDLNPASGPATPAEARARLDEALAGFAQACRERDSSGQPIDHTSFGTVSVADYARFMELHTRHHQKQI